MTAKLCLRCDWQGETDAQECPDCAEPLFGEGAARPSVAPPSSLSPPRRLSARIEQATPSPEPVEPTTTRSRQLVAIVVTALLLIFAVGSWLNAHTPDTRTTTQPVRLAGTLVYAVPDGADHSRLWRWDLVTGRGVRGPRVLRAAQLIDAHGANPGWIGVTSQLPDGRLQASVLRFLRPDDRATAVVRGDMIHWGPQGATVIAGRRGGLRPGCRRSVSIVWAKLVPALRERKYADPALCGDLLSIGQESVTTLFTLDRDGRVGIYFAGVGRIHRILAGHVLLAVSGLSDLLVVPQASLATLGPLPTRPEEEHGDLAEAGLYFRGLGEPRPLPYVEEGTAFALARTLAWSPDATVALVVGRLGVRRGLYELDTGPGDGLDPPRYVGPVAGIPYATFTHDGTPIVETATGLFAVIDGRLTPLEPPQDAPAPAGPIVWIG